MDMEKKDGERPRFYSLGDRTITNLSLRKLCAPVRSADCMAGRWEKSGRAVQWETGAATKSLYKGHEQSAPLAIYSVAKKGGRPGQSSMP